MNRYNERITFVYQPQIQVSTNQLTGIEVLTRYDGKSPYHFLTSMSAFEQSCHTWVQFKRVIELGQKFPHISFAINVELHQLLETPLVDWIDQTSFIPENITLEIIETPLPKTYTWKQVRGVTDFLKSKGIQISLDDLGESHSHFVRLGLLDVDEVKLSKRWVSLNQNEQKTWIKNIRNLTGDTRIVVEGVETALELEQVRTMYPEVHVQGYVFTPPIADLSSLLEMYA